MPKGNNIPWTPGDYAATPNRAPSHSPSGRKHDTKGARTSDGAGKYPNGLAGGGQPNGPGALGRAAGRRLFGNNGGSTSPGTSKYKRNSEGQ